MTFQIPTDWTFRSSHVAESFEQHVREQLPWYELASGAVAHVARHYIPEGGLIYDVGASTGNIGRLLADTLASRNAQLIAIEASAEMADLYAGPGILETSDAVTYDYQQHDVAVLFLVVMFLPPATRRTYLHRLYERMNAGGAMVVVDKCDDTCGYIATILRRLTLAGKVATGTTADDIIAKELSLVGVQRPIDLADLPGDPQVFFRFGEFTGWIIEKHHPET